MFLADRIFEWVNLFDIRYYLSSVELRPLKPSFSTRNLTICGIMEELLAVSIDTKILKTVRLYMSLIREAYTRDLRTRKRCRENLVCKWPSLRAIKIPRCLNIRSRLTMTANKTKADIIAH